jgi:hypothetical protein
MRPPNTEGNSCSDCKPNPNPNPNPNHELRPNTEGDGRILRMYLTMNSVTALMSSHNAEGDGRIFVFAMATGKLIKCIAGPGRTVVRCASLSSSHAPLATNCAASKALVGRWCGALPSLAALRP